MASKREGTTEVQNEVPAVRTEPLPVPDGFSGTKVPLVKLAEQYSTLLPMAATLAALSSTPEDVLLTSHTGEAIITAMAKDGQPEQLLFVTAENKDFVVAAIAALPQFRMKFAESVIAKIAEGRQSEGYKALLAAVDTAHEAYLASINACREATQAIAAPFDASIFIDTYSIGEVRPKGVAVQSNGTAGGGRTRAKSETEWNLPMYKYPQSVNGVQYFMYNATQRNGVWTIESESGDEVARGASASIATKAWYESRAMSTAVSAPNVWKAAQQEAEAQK